MKQIFPPHKAPYSPDIKAFNFSTPLYPIVNLENFSSARRIAEGVFRAGIPLLQLRAKTLSADQFKSFAREIKNLRETIGAGTAIIINDCPKLAAELSLDGVHLGQEDSSISEARELLGPEAVIGLSTHSLEQITQAPFSLLNYLALGPIFESSSKSGHAEVVGLELLKTCSEASPLPLVAIGGIDLSRAESVLKQGASAVAVISDLLEGELSEKLKVYSGLLCLA